MWHWLLFTLTHNTGLMISCHAQHGLLILCHLNPAASGSGNLLRIITKFCVSSELLGLLSLSVLVLQHIYSMVQCHRSHQAPVGPKPELKAERRSDLYLPGGQKQDFNWQWQDHSDHSASVTTLYGNNMSDICFCQLVIESFFPQVALNSIKYQFRVTELNSYCILWQ